MARSLMAMTVFFLHQARIDAKWIASVRRSSRLALAAISLLLIMLCNPAAAQQLADPTRPALVSTAVAGADGNVEESTGPVLQSILIAPHRHVAIISGQTVALNGKYGNQTLIRMSETEVVLRNGRTLQTLTLFPDFNKKLSHGSNRPHSNSSNSSNDGNDGSRIKFNTMRP